ncbi:MAG: MFS transporter, partial [Chloroflexota bacterium]
MAGNRPNPWVIVAVSTIQQAGLTFIRFGLPALAPFIRAESGLSLGQVGLLLGAFDGGALLAFYLVGRLTIWTGERAVLAGGALATGLLT